MELLAAPEGCLLGGPTRSIGETIAGWGAAVEVLEPDSVRAELASLGFELVAR